MNADYVMLEGNWQTPLRLLELLIYWKLEAIVTKMLMDSTVW